MYRFRRPSPMYLALIYSVIITAILLAVLYHFQKTSPTDSTGISASPEEKRQAYKSLVATGFFVFIVLLIGFHLLGIGESAMGSSLFKGGASGPDGGSSSKLPEYESGMVKNIHQQIQTGFPPF